ncbi:hypothetical protein TorRG33x02_246870 [Trema orientale]|uniref:Uncharacterized protein n=1 Tax=Trema orientale TaxID=63057 RepID=A0A2P5DMY6_TREOI|nr:hypothetical protein TorRG33x02_246870 [Trema orientale]
MAIAWPTTTAFVAFLTARAKARVSQRWVLGHRSRSRIRSRSGDLFWRSRKGWFWLITWGRNMWANVAIMAWPTTTAFVAFLTTRAKGRVSQRWVLGHTRIRSRSRSRNWDRFWRSRTFWFWLTTWGWHRWSKMAVMAWPTTTAFVAFLTTRAKGRVSQRWVPGHARIRSRSRSRRDWFWPITWGWIR